jgi:hypothetical protein
MGPNCAPLLADLLLHSYEAEFVKKLLHEKEKKTLGVGFNSTVISIYRHFYLLATMNSIHVLIRYIPISWKSKTPQSVPHLLKYLDILLTLDTDCKIMTMTNGTFSISPSSTSLTLVSYVAILHFHLHMVFISRSWFGMEELARHTISF